MRAFPIAVLLLSFSACGRPGTEVGARRTADAVSIVDDAGRTITLPRPATRVISLKPSVTETLVAFGARDLVVARTDFDEDPSVAGLPSIGGALEPNMEVIAGLRPDLVIIWETTAPAVRERIEALGVPTFTVRSVDTTDVYRSFRNLGRLVGRAAAGDSLADALRAELAAVAASVRGRPRPSTFVVVWNDPPMTAGPGTYLGQLVSIAGGESAFPELGKEFANVALEELVRRQPQVVVLPQGEDDKLRADRVKAAPGWRDLRAMQGTGPARVPSDLVSRAGPNLAEAARRLRDAIHPELAGQ